MSTTEAHSQESTVLSDCADLDESADHATLVSAVNSLTEAVTELAEENRRLRERVEELENDQEEQDQHRAQLAKDVATANGRITDVEDRLSEDEPHPSDGEDTDTDTSATPETPLEDITALPEHVAEDSLSANQNRARFVVSDLEEYTRSVPAGRSITASDLSTVLRAGTDAKGHSQTVDRVIRLLDDLGDGGTKVVERHGQRRVVFTEDCARRLSRLSENHGVVTGGKDGGVIEG